MVPAGPRRSYDIERFEARHIIIVLRREGMSYDEISQELLDYDPPIKLEPQTIAGIISKYLREMATLDSESVEDLRQLENERLDKLWMAYYTAAVGDPENDKPPNLKAASFLLSLSARRAKMNGLDAANKVEHFGKIDHLHELGVDPDEIREAEQAFRDTYRDPGIDPPAIVEVQAEVIEEAVDD